ncbi:MAG TPA: 16S rRNA (cytosine(1402)-N(4))-methyltransferase RsmH [Bacteroidia bacterium]|nr:16S rRNA (cytosine(1402)-N(4))-methyltransferase RsmH [Bacteroidia bacterium]
MTKPVYHNPVLLQACIDLLNIQPSGVYVDLTFGGGGHSAHILKHLGEKGRLFAFDQDEDAKRNVLQDPRFTLIPQNFRYLKNYLRLYGVNKVSGILGDLGVSSHQFDEAERGFSIRFEAELDMRMNRKSALSARILLNTYSVEQLAKLFRDYADLPQAGRLARLIAESRMEKEIVNTADLREAIKTCLPKFEENKFMARVFQALRMEVNQEVDALRECLEQCVDLLESGGRLVIISYHSIEDRMVKNLMRSGNTEGREEKDIIYGTGKKVFRLLGSKPIVPEEEEIRNNTRARSAKLRAAEKLD